MKKEKRPALLIVLMSPAQNLIKIQSKKKKNNNNNNNKSNKKTKQIRIGETEGAFGYS